MSVKDSYRNQLLALPDWDPYLLEHSGLPGPRGNLELADVVADMGDKTLFFRYLSYTPERAPTGTAEEYLAFCGVLGLGTLLAQGDERLLPLLKSHANDPRWRIREAVAMALQRWGKVEMLPLLGEMQAWCKGSLLEQRAAAAAICEPALLKDPSLAEPVFSILDCITEGITRQGDRRSEAFRTLRKGMGYCWSVAVAAYPETGKDRMMRWIPSDDPDVRWIMRSNLGKARLTRPDPDWVNQAQGQLTRPPG